MFRLPHLLQKIIIAKLFELAIVTGIVSTFYNIVSERSEYAIEAAETSELQWTLAAIRTTLHYRVVYARINGRNEELRALEGSNPVALLDRPPPGYAGEFENPDLKFFRGGTWFFDKKDKVLVYLLNGGNYFSGGVSKMLKFKVELSRIPTLPEGAASSYRAELVQLATM